jgi:hypothetical protein
MLLMPQFGCNDSHYRFSRGAYGGEERDLVKELAQPGK